MDDDELDRLLNPDAEGSQLLDAIFAHMTPRAWSFHAFVLRRSLCHAHLVTRREGEPGASHTTSTSQFDEAFQAKVATLLERAIDENPHLTVEQVTTIGRVLQKEAQMIQGQLNAYGS